MRTLLYSPQPQMRHMHIMPDTAYGAADIMNDGKGCFPDARASAIRAGETYMK